MGSLGPQWAVEGQGLIDAVRRRARLDAGPFRPAGGRVLDESWIPRGLAPYGFERARRMAAVTVGDIPASGPCDAFRRAVQRYRTVIDDPRSGLPAEERARRLVRAAACGTPVAAGADLASLVPEALIAGSTEATSALVDDQEQMPAMAYRQWSAAFDHFSPVACSVSITIVTNRPAHLSAWLNQIGAQSHRNLQVVVALHSDKFKESDRDLVRQTMGDCGINVVIIDVPPSFSLGAALDEARRRADGDVILKWDDDDLYSSSHVTDLLRARRYAGAPLVGKACDFVYLGSRNMTVRRHQADREVFSPTLSGNSLMIDRDALEAVGGWDDVSLGEDRSLITKVRRAGGATYRTVGFGMMAVRYSDVARHTWNLDETSLMSGAVQTWPALALDAALVDVPAEVSDEVRRLAAGGR